MSQPGERRHSDQGVFDRLLGRGSPDRHPNSDVDSSWNAYNRVFSRRPVERPLARRPFTIVRRPNWSLFDRFRSSSDPVDRHIVAKQMLAGSVSGMLSGFLFVRVGKVAAASMGTTILIFQIARHLGYINIDWERVHRTARTTQQGVRRAAESGFIDFTELQDFLQENMYLAVCFAGGFLVGMAF